MLRQRPFKIERQRGATGRPLPGATPANNGGPDAGGLAGIKQAIEEMRGEIRALASGATASEQSSFDTEAFKQQVVEAERLKGDLQELSDAIERTKQEIATLRKADAGSDKIATASEALRAVVGDTETATNGIINAAEEVEEIAGRLRAELQNREAQGHVDELFEAATKIFENCNFQDITGQRITKVVNTMEFIDGRVHRMMEIWGGDTAFAGLETEDEPLPEHSERLHGPAMDGDSSISQDEIDALFD